MDAFDKWMNRPVYVVQCYTAKIARSLSIWNAEYLFHFRNVKKYRGEPSRLIRSATASKILEMRKRGILDRKAVRLSHKNREGGGGVAMRCDLEAMFGT